MAGPRLTAVFGGHTRGHAEQTPEIGAGGRCRFIHCQVSHTRQRVRHFEYECRLVPLAPSALGRQKRRIRLNQHLVERQLGSDLAQRSTFWICQIGLRTTPGSPCPAHGAHVVPFR